MTRTRFKSTLMILGVVVLVAALAATAFAQAGRGGGPRDGRQAGPGADGPRGGEGRGATGALGMMGEVLYLERTWAVLCFQIDLEDEQFEQVWKLYGEVMHKRNTGIQAAVQNQNMEAYRQATAEAKATLEYELPKILTEEQWERLDTLKEAIGGMGRGARPQPN